MLFNKEEMCLERGQLFTARNPAGFIFFKRNYVFFNNATRMMISYRSVAGSKRARDSTFFVREEHRKKLFCVLTWASPASVTYFSVPLLNKKLSRVEGKSVSLGRMLYNCNINGRMDKTRTKCLSSPYRKVMLSPMKKENRIHRSLKLNILMNTQKPLNDERNLYSLLFIPCKPTSHNSSLSESEVDFP